MKIRVLKTVSAVVAAVIFGGMFSSCTKEYKITEPSGSFVMNDSVIGIIKWEYIQNQSDNIFAASSHEGVRQYFCKYYINTGNLKEVKKLRNDARIVNEFYNVVYNYPYIYFCTKTNKDYIGIYNLETGENEVFEEGNKPICVSEDNRYLGFYYLSDPTYYYGIFDYNKETIIWEGVKYKPIYIDGTNKRTLLLNLSIVNLETGEVIDTLDIDIQGRIYHNASNDITVFESDSGGFYYLNNSELIEGIFEPHKIENLNSYGTGHVDIKNEKAVYTDAMGIYYINYGDNKVKKTIMESKKEEQ